MSPSDELSIEAVGILFETPHSSLIPMRIGHGEEEVCSSRSDWYMQMTEACWRLQQLTYGTCSSMQHLCCSAGEYWSVQYETSQQSECLPTMPFAYQLWQPGSESIAMETKASFYTFSKKEKLHTFSLPGVSERSSAIQGRSRLSDSAIYLQAVLATSPHTWHDTWVRTVHSNASFSSVCARFPLPS